MTCNDSFTEETYRAEKDVEPPRRRTRVSVPTPFSGRASSPMQPTSLSTMAWIRVRGAYEVEDRLLELHAGRRPSCHENHGSRPRRRGMTGPLRRRALLGSLLCRSSASRAYHNRFRGSQIPRVDVEARRIWERREEMPGFRHGLAAFGLDEEVTAPEAFQPSRAGPGRSEDGGILPRTSGRCERLSAAAPAAGMAFGSSRRKRRREEEAAQGWRPGNGLLQKRSSASAKAGRSWLTVARHSALRRRPEPSARRRRPAVRLGPTRRVARVMSLECCSAGARETGKREERRPYLAL